MGSVRAPKSTRQPDKPKSNALKAGGVAGMLLFLELIQVSLQAADDEQVNIL
ncbi:hypothetical protein D9M68_853070 [compost metagenome]